MNRLQQYHRLNLTRYVKPLAAPDKIMTTNSKIEHVMLQIGSRLSLRISHESNHGENFNDSLYSLKRDFVLANKNECHLTRHKTLEYIHKKAKLLYTAL